MLLAHYDKERSLEQSLLDHSISTASIAKDKGEKIDLAHMCFIVGLLHDVGKADRNFQEKLRKNSNRKVIHSSAGLKYLLGFLEENNGENRLFREYIEILAYAVGAHHGVFDIPDQDEDYVWISKLYLKAQYNTKKYHYEEEVLRYIEDLDKFVQERWGKSIEDFLLLGFEEYQSSKSKLKPIDYQEEAFYTGLYVRLILSILKSADVLDTINAYGNVLSPLSGGQYDSYRESYLQSIEDLYVSFGEAKSQINKIRSLGGERAKERGKVDDPGIYRLDLPTGAGKTQISLRYSIHQFKYKRKARIFYVTPFLSVLEQNAQVIRGIVKEGVLEHHSNIVEDGEGNEDHLESKEYAFREYLKETWDSPMVVTTMVQFANSLFKNKSAHLRRFSSLIEAVVILDEVQSLPVNVTYMFNSMMNFMAKVMRTTIIHCTATQPNYDSDRIKYPLSYGGRSHPDIVSLSKEERKVFDRTEIYRMNEGEPVELEDIVKELLVNSENSYLVVLNTKAAVKELYELCKKRLNRKTYYLSTNLCPAHRRDIIEEIRKELARGQAIACISTQLIEAGVDLDFNRLIRSYAGIDSIIQAAGRCNREGKIVGGMGIVKLAYLDKEIENLKMLKDIDKKKKITRDILMSLEEERIDISEFNKEFFERYFVNSENEMYCWAQEKGDKFRLYDLLSTNDEYELDFDNNIVLNQSFQRAGRAFELIKDETRGIIVHYKESLALIEQLEKVIEDYYQTYEAEDYKKIKVLLRKLQPYTVNMYNIEKIKNNLIPLLDGEILVLFEGNYDKEMGVVVDEDLDSFIL